MEALNIWLLGMTLFGLCSMGRANQESGSTVRKRTIHIHQHDGDTTPENSTNILREEGKYFLKMLFTEYASGDHMDLTGLEKLLFHIRYDARGEAGHEHDIGEHGDHGISGHTPHGDTSKKNTNHEHGDTKHVHGDGKHVHIEHEHDHDHDDRHEHAEHTKVRLANNESELERKHGKVNSDRGVLMNSEHGNNDEDREHNRHEHHHGVQGENEVLDKKHEHDMGHEHSSDHDHQNSEGHSVHSRHHEHDNSHGHEDHEHSSDHGHEEKSEGHSVRSGHHEYDMTVHDHGHSSDHDHEKSEEHSVHSGHHEHDKSHRHEEHKHSSIHHHETSEEHGVHSEQRKHATSHEHGENKSGELQEQKPRVHIEHDEHDEHGHGFKKHEHGLRKNHHKHEHTKLQKHDDQEGNKEHGKDTEESNLKLKNHGKHGKHKLVDKYSSTAERENKHYPRKRKQEKKTSNRRKQMKRNKRSALHRIHHIHDVHDGCSSVKDLFKIFHLDQKRKISERDFLHICPAIIYQLNKPHCRPREAASSHDHSHGRRTQVGGISGRVWGYSSAAVLVISLVGLLGVAVIPIMQRIFYNQLLQFLVAMAVGALTGDAMLHLLPHAIAGEVSVEEGGGEGHDHSGGVWKGMCGLAGIYFFFILQRLLTIITGVRNKRQRRRKDRMLQKQRSPDGSGGVVRLSTYDNLKDDANGNIAVFIPAPDSVSKNEQLTPLKPDANAHDAEEDDHVGHSHGGHGHSHHDGPIPTSVSAVAWMVILGDGVHNLSDGLAIGAAFASSITGGLSTAIAVFCHELPHEIGDFAVLLNAGMSVKQAVLYNCLSSVLSFIGMLIGVGLGNIHEASTWIFAAVGGMFIYISLVNMIPELTSVVSPKPLRDLILQCIGMCVGSGIMLAIAVYEKDLLTVLG